MNDWIKCSAALPAIDVVVWTKIDGDAGERNVAMLKRGGRNGSLWFFPDDSMYVYYRPTHWKNLTSVELSEIEARKRSEEIQKRDELLKKYPV